MLSKTSSFKRDETSARRSNTQPLTVNSMMREVLHTLGNMDFSHDLELEKLEASNTEKELKQYIRSKLVARHRERREPYVELLSELRKQTHRITLAA